MTLTKQQKLDLQSNLLQWFEEEGRDHLPWRQTDDPYAILVAEKLLQQTSVRQLVIDAYAEFMGRYPTPEVLADAAVAEIKELIHSLGFMYRAEELVKLANELIERHDGKVPNDLEALLALTGVGDYCARAVLSFAFSQDVPIVDVNVAWFLHRILGIGDPLPSSPASNKKLRELATSLLPPGKAKEYNLAILDLCSAICTRRNPDCENCPLKRVCAYGKQRLSTTDLGD